ncbi:MAG: aminoacyl-tRNA hydrolase [Clostridia bacterium]
MDELYVIVGLGNPGSNYAQTRHNIGFITIDELCFRHGIRLNKLKFKASFGEGQIAGKRVLLVKPQTFMNDSGLAVRDLATFYKIPLENLIVVYDDVDLPTGRIRVREKGSAGTHNGMRSIVYQLDAQNFPRVRIGVGKPEHPEHELVDYVLARFPKEEHEIMLEAVKRAADAVEEILKNDAPSAIRMYNKS